MCEVYSGKLDDCSVRCTSVWSIISRDMREELAPMDGQGPQIRRQQWYKRDKPNRELAQETTRRPQPTISPPSSLHRIIFAPHSALSTQVPHTTTATVLLRTHRLGISQFSVLVIPLKPSVIIWLQFQCSAPYRPNLPFLISDIRALWRSRLSARVPDCQKLKYRLDLDSKV